MEEWKIQNKKDLENQLLQLRAQLLINPLNRNIQQYINDYEKCLKNAYPDSKLIDKKKEKPPKKEKTPKTRISATIKRLVWNANIGEEIGKSKCVCCKTTDITQMSFHCGHVVSEKNGGDTIVSNLKPICQNCNSCMGTRNMNEFILTLK
jgi:5-methylcytosine-specific restriction endonuclease McrA